MKQLTGAKRTLLQQQEEIHTDLSLQLAFPLEFPEPGCMKVHLVAVAHGASAACNLHWGRPSLQIDTAIKGDENALTIGCLFDDEFVHVFDDFTLDVIFGRRDTLPDFIHYLKQKEKAIRAERFIIPGEENLLAHYLVTRDAYGEHFVPARSADSDSINRLHENAWSEYSTSERIPNSWTARRSHAGTESINCSPLMALKSRELSTGWRCLSCWLTKETLIKIQVFASD